MNFGNCVVHLDKLLRATAVTCISTLQVGEHALRGLQHAPIRWKREDEGLPGCLLETGNVEQEAYALKGEHQGGLWEHANTRSRVGLSPNQRCLYHLLSSRSAASYPPTCQ